MEPKIYFVTDIFSAVACYEYDILSGKTVPHPIKGGDLIIWDEQSGIEHEKFERWMDLYFEYVVHGILKSMYRVTGVLTIKA